MAEGCGANYKPGLPALDEMPPRVYDRGGTPETGTSGAIRKRKDKTLLNIDLKHLANRSISPKPAATTTHIHLRTKPGGVSSAVLSY